MGLLVSLLGNSWFVFELLLRFAVAPSKLLFCTSVMNWIGKTHGRVCLDCRTRSVSLLLDFLGTFFFCFTYILYNAFQYDGHYAALDLLSTIRVARMFKLINLHPRLKVIVATIAYSSNLLTLLVFFFFVSILIAGASLYYIERISNAADNQLISVMDGLWLALSTMSTLGFGEVVPRSLFGMVVGAIATIIGVLIIDLPMPIIVEIFANFYTHLKARQQLPKQRRRTTPAPIPHKVKPLMPAKDNRRQED